MSIRMRVTDWLARKLPPNRPPDRIITHEDDGGVPYMRRWHLIPRNPLFNIYFHEYGRSDDARAPHDHPWWNISWFLSGTFMEVEGPPEASRVFFRHPGDIVFRRATSLHRIVLAPFTGPYRTLFITGPRVREWGFQTKNGWKYWEDFQREVDGS